MSTADPALIEWESIDIFIDCAFAVLGDRSLLSDPRWRETQWPALLTGRGGLGMLLGLAECDFMPVEVGRVGESVVGARLEFGQGVTEIERAGSGRWEALGCMSIRSDGAVAADLRSPKDRLCALPLPAGWYGAEVFNCEADHFGIRLITDTAPPSTARTSAVRR